MFDSIIEKLLTSLLGGGPQAIIAILILFVVLLLADRRRLIKEIARKDDKVEKIVDDYFKGNLSLTDALNNLKIVLYEIKSKIT